jgi:hypothetical protein
VLAQLERLGGDGRSLAAVRAWADAVGPSIAANAWPARLSRDGTLVVHTTSSVWAQELTHMEDLVRERLGAAAPARIRFAVGVRPEPGTEAERPRPAPRRAGAAEQSIGASIAAPIAGDELREAVARAIAASLARRGDDRSF